MLDFGARQFSRKLCRFLSVDPIDDPSASLYRYADNNFLNKIDPDGRQDQSVVRLVRFDFDLSRGATAIYETSAGYVKFMGFFEKNDYGQIIMVKFQRWPVDSGNFEKLAEFAKFDLGPAAVRTMMQIYSQEIGKEFKKLGIKQTALKVQLMRTSGTYSGKHMGRGGKVYTTDVETGKWKTRPMRPASGGGWLGILNFFVPIVTFDGPSPDEVFGTYLGSYLSYFSQLERFQQEQAQVFDRYQQLIVDMGPEAANQWLEQNMSARPAKPTLSSVYEELSPPETIELKLAEQN